MLHAYFETKVDKIILLQLINKKYQLLINKSSGFTKIYSILLNFSIIFCFGAYILFYIVKI